MKKATTLIGCATLAEARAWWVATRDRLNLGSSNSPIVCVLDTQTLGFVCSISYNGRLWDDGGKEIVL